MISRTRISISCTSRLSASLSRFLIPMLSAKSLINFLSFSIDIGFIIIKFVMRISFVILLLSLLVCSTLAASPASMPIPNATEGIRVGNVSSPSRMDVYYDILCSDSADMNPEFSRFLEMMANKRQRVVDAIDVVYHFFPLPYHYNSFLCTEMLTYVYHTYGTAAAVTYFNNMFKVYDLYNGPYLNLTEYQVRAQIATDTQLWLKIQDNNLSQIFTNATVGQNTRIAWKYGCYQSLFGTPTVLLNSVQLADTPETAEGWFALIKPYF